MNKAKFLFIGLIFSSSLFSQVDIIRTQSDQLFFYIPINSDQYSIRKTLNRDVNFFNTTEFKSYCNCISSEFRTNTILKYIGTDKSIVIWFDQSTKKSKSRKISFKYPPEQLEKAENQLKHLHSLYSKISYDFTNSTIYNARDDRSGEGYTYYSSSNSVMALKPFLEISMRYIQASNYGSNSFYLFEIILNENSMF